MCLYWLLRNRKPTSRYPNLDDSVENAEDLTAEEIDKKPRGMKNHKAPGPEDTPIKLVKQSQNQVKEILA